MPLHLKVEKLGRVVPACNWVLSTEFMHDPEQLLPGQSMRNRNDWDATQELPLITSAWRRSRNGAPGDWPVEDRGERKESVLLVDETV